MNSAHGGQLLDIGLAQVAQHPSAFRLTLKYQHNFPSTTNGNLNHNDQRHYA